MVEFTLFEVHLDEGSITANAPFSSAEELPEESSKTRSRFLSRGSDDTNTEIEVETPEDSGGSKLPKLGGLIVFVLLVIGIRRLLGGQSEPIEDVQ
jgi:hypothetical protein